MSSVREFLASLSSTDSDRFVAVVQRLNRLSSEGEITELEGRLSQVKAALEDAHNERVVLKRELEDLRRSVLLLDEGLEQGWASAELVSLRLILLQESAKLEEQIYSTRPDDLHAQKASLRKQIAERRLLGRLAGMILAGKRKPNG